MFFLYFLLFSAIDIFSKRDFFFFFLMVIGKLYKHVPYPHFPPHSSGRHHHFPPSLHHYYHLLPQPPIRSATTTATPFLPFLYTTTPLTYTPQKSHDHHTITTIGNSFLSRKLFYTKQMSILFFMFNTVSIKYFIFRVLWRASYVCYCACLISKNQVDVQALVHAVELTRQGAVDSLRFSKGDLFLAFQVSK